MTVLAKATKDDVVPEGKRFTNAEWRAFEAHKKASAAGLEPLLSPTLSGQMFEQFLQGMTCTMIARHWQGIKLGQVVGVCIEQDWMGRKEEYLEHVLGTVGDRAKQTSGEVVDFVSTLLAVAHKQWGENLRRYLATGNETELKGFEIRSIDQYRKAIQTFLEMTGHKPGEYLKTAAGDKGQATGGLAGGGLGLDLLAILSTKDIPPEAAAALLRLLATSTPEKVPVPEKDVTTVTMKP